MAPARRRVNPRRDRPSLRLLEQILEDEPAPGAAACVHQRATLVELSQVDGGQGGRNQVIADARAFLDAVSASWDRAIDRLRRIVE
jgi:hypothetical protein